ncbi:hypothetical protein QTU86_003891, partial [Escherichia coli]|nr:hypothetical protein [Escherichia coli]
GEGAKQPASSGNLNANGWVKIPIGNDKTLLVQWGVVSTSTNALTYVCDIKFPVTFPVTCFAVASGSGVYTGDLDRNSRYRNLKQEVNFGLASASGVQAQLIVTDGSTGDARFLYWIALGY